MASVESRRKPLRCRCTEVKNYKGNGRDRGQQEKHRKALRTIRYIVVSNSPRGETRCQQLPETKKSLQRNIKAEEVTVQLIKPEKAPFVAASQENSALAELPSRS